MPAVRDDHGLGEFVPPEPWTAIAEGVTFSEGPVWLPDGSLLFSDIPNSRIHRVSDGGMSVYRAPSGQSNGLTLDLDMRVIACEHEGRRVSVGRDGEGYDATEALATHYEGKRLNSPNDVVVRSDGRIFFTDPPYGIREEQRELPFNGVYTIGSDGELSLLASDFERPNGLALSPDERTLYIADTARLHVRAFDVSEGGVLSGDRIFASMADNGRPDGMKVDRDGRLYVAAGTLQVFDAAGDPLGAIECPQSPANCAWGADDGSTLIITARTAVYSTRLDVVGVAPHLRAARPRI